MNKKENQLSERDNMLQLLVEAYGSLKDSPRIEFENNNLKDIAKELGYDEGQLSRTFNPPKGKDISRDSYKRVIQRLSILKENKSLKEQLVLSSDREKKGRVFRNLSFFFALICLIASIFCFTNKGISTSPKKSKSYISDNSRQRIIRLIETRNSLHITIAMVLFNERVRNQEFSANRIDSEIQSLFNGLKNSLEENRHQLRDIGLYTHNGINIADLADDTYSSNDMRNGFKKLIPSLISPDMSIESLVSLIKGIAQEQHRLIEQKADSIIKNQ